MSQRRFLAAVAGCILLQSALATDPASRPCAGSLAVPMERERTGHVSVRLAVNGSPVRVLVDTGANTNTLDAAAAQVLNLDVVSSIGLPSGQGHADSPVAVGEVPLGRHSFTVMDLGFINVASKRYGTEPFAGQLGASFFTQLNAKIDFAHMVMCLAVPGRAL